MRKQGQSHAESKVYISDRKMGSRMVREERGVQRAAPARRKTSIQQVFTKKTRWGCPDKLVVRQGEEGRQGLQFVPKEAKSQVVNAVYPCWLETSFDKDQSGREPTGT